jgi:hypothetical protein
VRTVGGVNEILLRCAEVIADRPQWWSRLLADHVPGPDGRCRACPSAVSAAPRWPCRIAVLADAARGLSPHGRPPSATCARPGEGAAPAG